MKCVNRKLFLCFLAISTIIVLVLLQTQQKGKVYVNDDVFPDIKVSLRQDSEALHISPECLIQVKRFLTLQRTNFNSAWKFEPHELFHGARNVYEVELMDFLPADGVEPVSLMDIGCGLGLYNTFVLRRYRYNPLSRLYLVDKSTEQIEEKGFSHGKFHQNLKSFPFYTSLECAAQILMDNGGHEDIVQPITANISNIKMLTSHSIDVVYSLLSWGFHYPASTYAAEVFRLLKPSGFLLIHLRKPVQSKLEELTQVGFKCKSMNAATKKQKKYSEKYRSKYEVMKCQH